MVRTLCSIEDCGRVRASRLGYCAMHRRRHEKGHDLYEIPKGQRDKICYVEDCNNRSNTKGLCSGHELRRRKGKDYLTPLRPMMKDRGCLVEGCDRPHNGNGYCVSHNRRIKLNVDVNIPVRKFAPNTWSEWKENPDGYIFRYGNFDGTRKMELLHRIIVEQTIGRKLENYESVHHKNGNRSDNRLSNLELWSTRQPKGQRVQDKVAWAKEILDLYGNMEFN